MVERDFVFSEFRKHKFAIHGRNVHLKATEQRPLRWFLYLLKCVPCHAQYVASTQNASSRFKDHKLSANIKKNSSSSDIAKHFPNICPNDNNDQQKTQLRAQVPRIQRRGLRGRLPGFYKCGRRSNCAPCLHSENANSYTCPFTRATITISQHITCQSAGVYLLFCRKDTGVCSRLAPTYVGICGEGEQSSFTTRRGWASTWGLPPSPARWTQ